MSFEFQKSEHSNTASLYSLGVLLGEQCHHHHYLYWPHLHNSDHSDRIERYHHGTICGAKLSFLISPNLCDNIWDRVWGIPCLRAVLTHFLQRRHFCYHGNNSSVYITGCSVVCAMIYCLCANWCQYEMWCLSRKRVCSARHVCSAGSWAGCL